MWYRYTWSRRVFILQIGTFSRLSVWVMGVESLRDGGLFSSGEHGLDEGSNVMHQTWPILSGLTLVDLSVQEGALGHIVAAVLVGVHVCCLCSFLLCLSVEETQARDRKKFRSNTRESHIGSHRLSLYGRCSLFVSWDGIVRRPVHVEQILKIYFKILFNIQTFLRSLSPRTIQILRSICSLRWWANNPDALVRRLPIWHQSNKKPFTTKIFTPWTWLSAWWTMEPHKTDRPNGLISCIRYCCSEVEEGGL